MTYQKAIQMFQNFIDNKQFTPRMEIALLLASKALEKQIPQKAIIRPTRSFFKDERCPNCDSFFIGHHNFCGECGQAIDWSENEIGE